VLPCISVGVQFGAFLDGYTGGSFTLLQTLGVWERDSALSGEIRRFGCAGQGVIGLSSYFVLPVWVCFGNERFSCTKIAMLFLVNVIKASYLNRHTWDICALLTNKCRLDTLLGHRFPGRSQNALATADGLGLHHNLISNLLACSEVTMEALCLRSIPRSTGTFHVPYQDLATSASCITLLCCVRNDGILMPAS
jgi:hypothetical protein